MPKTLSKIQNAIKLETTEGSVGRLDISGEVGWDWYGDAWDAGYFKSQLDGLGEVNLLEVHINSPGGNVMDGIAIFNYLVQHKAPVHVYVDGVAASIASVIAMAGDKIFMPSNTMLFIHDPWMYTAGNAEELRKDAETLDTVQKALVASYQRHFKGSDEDVATIMANDTWMTANEAEEQFSNVTVLAQEAQIAASLDLSKLGDGIPDQAKAFLAKEEDEKVSLVGRLKNFLKGEGFAKAAEGLEEDLAGTETHKEDNMTPEEIVALKADITEGVMAGLKEAGVIRAKEEEPEPKAVELKFEGDPMDEEVVRAHAEKLKQAQLQASVDWSDPASVAAYQEAVFGKKEVPAGSSNADVPAEPSASQKVKDKEDTLNHMAKFMPKKGAK